AARRRIRPRGADRGPRPRPARDAARATRGGAPPGGMTPATDALWQRYRGSGDLDARAQLLAGYLGLVHHTAHEMRRNRPGVPELDDLIGAGTLGLVQALEGFDPGRGLAFSTYAMPRIRGAMLDEIHAQDWAPRSVRERRRLLAAARAELA